MKYPEITVQLTGVDGNALSIIAAVASVIREGVSAEAADAYVHEAMDQPSYEALLRHVRDTVATV